MLDKKEIDLANFWKKIYQYNPVYFKNLTNEFNSNSLSLIYKLIKGNKINFFIKKLIGNKNSQVFFFKKILENTNVSIDEFIEFSSQLLKIYKTGFELGINIDDLHGDNLGRRGDELVAFDCTAPD